VGATLQRGAFTCVRLTYEGASLCMESEEKAKSTVRILTSLADTAAQEPCKTEWAEGSMVFLPMLAHAGAVKE